MKNKHKTTFSLVGYLIFLFVICVLISGAFIIFSLTTEATDHKGIIAVVLLGYVLIASIISTLIDFFRRKIMIEKPLIRILEATEEMIKGNYEVDLKVTHTLKKYDAFDIISDNLNDLAKELKNTEMMHNDFISNVSHEIKTPLTIISNYAKALQNQKLSNEEREKYTHTIELATKRLTGLVNNMLKLNKLENQGLTPVIEMVNLTESLSQCILVFENALEKKKIELQCNLDDVTIYSVPSYLEMIWNNLISNAIKFTDFNGTIEITLHQEEDRAIMTIKDNGCGISPEEGKHIFDKFYQADTSHASEGNGLGLALVKRIIDILGGEIRVESVVGEGTTFIVKLKNQKNL